MYVLRLAATLFGVLAILTLLYILAIVVYIGALVIQAALS